MPQQNSRRDFLKLVAASAAGISLSGLLREEFSGNWIGETGRPNVIFLVFDTMSASHLSLYGYPRATTPNLERFAQRANTYHAHYSTANFTTPGTSSLLTGLYPWTHRALQFSGLVARDQTGRNIFASMGPDYHRFAFSQNVMATNLLNQFRDGIDRLLASSSFSELSLVASEFFAKDANTAHQVQDNFLFDFVDPPGSLVFGLAQRLYFEERKKFDRDFPRGIPQPRNYPIVYKLEHLFNGLMDTLDGLPKPHFSYIHIFSPHAPYRAHRDFIGMFDDGRTHIRKPAHVFTEGESYETIEQNRIWYEEYIANVDFEFGRFLDHLEITGRLDDTYLVVTSDHGELLERGVKGHLTPLLYEPLVRVPLLISSPGQTRGIRIHSPTSSVDLLPTLLSVTGRPVPDWTEGRLLPGMGGMEDPEREICMLEAKSSSAFGKLTRATFAMRRGKYKIILYRGYEVFDGDRFEVYDLENDPEELNELSGTQPALADELGIELIRKFDEIDQK